MTPGRCWVRSVLCHPVACHSEEKRQRQVSLPGRISACRRPLPAAHDATRSAASGTGQSVPVGIEVHQTAEGDHHATAYRWACCDAGPCPSRGAARYQGAAAAARDRVPQQRVTERVGAHPLGISENLTFSQKTFADSLQLPYLLLSDRALSVIKAYGVLYGTTDDGYRYGFTAYTEAIDKLLWRCRLHEGFLPIATKDEARGRGEARPASVCGVGNA